MRPLRAATRAGGGAAGGGGGGGYYGGGGGGCYGSGGGGGGGSSFLMSVTPLGDDASFIRFYDPANPLTGSTTANSVYLGYNATPSMTFELLD